MRLWTRRFLLIVVICCLWSCASCTEGRHGFDWNPLTDQGVKNQAQVVGDEVKKYTDLIPGWGVLIGIAGSFFFGTWQAALDAKKKQSNLTADPAA